MRTNNSIRNIIVSLITQIITFGLSFISRTVFINQLGANYLGISGLFSNILSMLSLTELGVGSAITYSLYKPIAEDDKDKIKALMELFARCYKMIGVIIAILGILIAPNIEFFIKDNPNIPNLKLIYILYLSNSVVSYFFSYKRTLIIADQKGYLNTINQFKFNTVSVIFQIIILIVTRNYLLYLTSSILFNLMSNVFISNKVDKLYPYLKEHKEVHLCEDEKKDIVKYTLAAMSHKVGGVVVFGTDNILLSSFVGVFWVGIYSNYTLLIGILNTLLGQVFSSILASVGNLNATVDKEISYKVYNKIYFINFWIYGFCSICLWILINPFINLWLGEEYLLSKYIVLVIIGNFFINGMRQCTTTYNTTLGLFWNDRFKPWFEASINLIVSIILLSKFGFIGVLLGTFISTLTTSFWIEPYILYKHGFEKSVYFYFKQYAIYIFVVIFTAIITEKIAGIYNTISLAVLLYKLFICLIVPNFIFILIMFRTKEYKYLKNIFINTLLCEVKSKIIKKQNLNKV